MAKLKNYEAFPKRIGATATSGQALYMPMAPKKKMSKRGRRAQRNDIIEGALPLGIAAAVAFWLFKKSPRAKPDFALTTTNP